MSKDKRKRPDVAERNKNRPLTYKQKEFIKEVLDNPKRSLTKSAQIAYSRGDKEIKPTVAAQIAYENMNNPKIVSKLAQYSDMVESALLGTVQEWSASDKVSERALAMDSAKFIHDKVHGRATQRVETRSEAVTISIDMTQPASDVNS